MVQSVELLLDPVAEQRIRDQWNALLAADLPSLARHESSSNRPHVTLGVAGSVGVDEETAVAEAVRELPGTVRIGAPILFGPGPFVLARLVVPDIALLRLQQRVVRALADSGASFAHQSAGSWTGHVTLARRIRADQVAAALALVAAGSDVVGRPAGVRRWDGDRRIDWLITGPISQR